jgi:uncharacterized membrane-anchored protein
MIARRILACLLAAFLFLVGFKTLHAQETDGQKQAEALQQAVDAMQKVLRPGPGEVKLANAATLRLPQDAGFVTQPEAGAWASVVGYAKDVNLINPAMLGIAIPMSEENWVTFIQYHAGTRILDDAARTWDPDALLEAVKISTEAGNAAREQKGEPQIEVKGWLEKPHYDRATHKLIWATSDGEKGGDPDDGTANVHGYVLTRDGYFELTMVSPTAEVASHLAMAQALLGGLQPDAETLYDKGPEGGAKELGITSLIAPTPPSFSDKATTFVRTNGVSLAIGLLVLVALLAGLLFLLPRRSGR